MSETIPWRVSAIIPTYNRADYLPETIESLLAQSRPPFEIVLVDDGSTDATPDVAARYGRAVRYTRIPNSGAPVARNAGAALARGDWLWFCDSDDLWRPDYLEHCREIAGTSPHPQFIFGDFRLVRDDVWDPTTKSSTAPAGFWDGLQHQPVLGGIVFTQSLYGPILRFQPIFPSSVVLTRALFEKVGGYDPAFARIGSEDLEFTLRCVDYPPIGMVQPALVGIRRHPGNFSGNHLRALLGEVDILHHARVNHPAAAAHAELIDAEIRRRTLDALGQAFAQNDYRQVRRLACTLSGEALDLRSRVKVLIAGLPEAVRIPIVSAARLKNPSLTSAS